ncbi:DUF6959 family protein [Streptomyces sp. NPDC002187]|uniref:DUF6959 family protein n=1 Tax=Streptomyces sp. NPDC002187 TaxID=3364637 RepID=UPI00367DD1F4
MQTPRATNRSRRRMTSFLFGPWCAGRCRRPGRRFPGVLIQGDSLTILHSNIAEVVEAFDQGDVAGAREAAGLLPEELDELLARHSAALEAHEIVLPYRRPEL